MELLTAKEAAELLRLKVCTLYAKKAIPRIKLPGIRVVLFDRDELVKWAKGLLNARPDTASEPLGKRGVDNTEGITYDNTRWLSTL